MSAVSDEALHGCQCSSSKMNSECLVMEWWQKQRSDRSAARFDFMRKSVEVIKHYQVFRVAAGNRSEPLVSLNPLVTRWNTETRLHLSTHDPDDWMNIMQLIWLMRSSCLVCESVCVCVLVESVVCLSLDMIIVFFSNIPTHTLLE